MKSLGSPILFTVALIALMSPARAEQLLHTYETITSYEKSTFSFQVLYIAGLADAFSYVTEATGIEKGISDCLKKAGYNYITMTIHVVRHAIDKVQSRTRDRSIPIPKIYWEEMRSFCKLDLPSKIKNNNPHMYISVIGYYDLYTDMKHDYTEGIYDGIYYYLNITGRQHELSNCFKSVKGAEAFIDIRAKDAIKAATLNNGTERRSVAEAYYRAINDICRQFLTEKKT